MKLSYKVYSPFLFLFIMLYGCNKEEIAITDKSGEALKTIDTFKVAQGYLEKGGMFNSTKSFDSAFYYFNSSKILFALKKDSLRAGYSLIEMSRIQYVSGDYFGSEATATEALSYLEKTDNIEYKREIYNILGMNYKKLLNYDEALHYYNKSLKIAKDSLSKCIIQSNRASVYIEKKEYDKAISMLNALNTSDVVSNDPGTKARVLTNLGNVFLRTNRPQALDYIKQGFAIREKIGNPVDLLSSYILLSDFYVTKHRDIAKAYAEKAYAIAHKIKNEDEKLRALEVLILSSSGEDFRKYTVQYIELQDSVDIVRMIAKNQFARIKYDSKNVQEENVRLKTREENNRLIAEKDKAQSQLIFSLCAFIIIILLLLYFLMRMRYKKEKIKEVYNTENRIAKKVHDELANDVFRVMTFAETLEVDNPDKKEKLIQDLDNVYGRTRNISRENSAIDTGEKYPVVIKEMLAAYNATIIKVAVIGIDTIGWNEIHELKKIALYRILQELLVNMKKHSQASLVVVKFNKAGKLVEVNYTDNGIGFKDDIALYKNGLQNMESRITLIGGTISFNSERDKGLKVNIAFPA